MALDSNFSRKNYYRRNSRSPFLKGFIWGGAFTLTATISGIIGATIALKTSLPVKITPILKQMQGFKDYGLSSFFIPKLVEPVNILVMGIDRLPNVKKGSPQMFAGRSDTILLIRFQPQDRSLRIVSIPRDSRVKMPSGGYDKVNSANARGGADFSAEVITNNLNNVKIDHYVRVTTDAFRELIDVLGGVEVYIPQSMYYKDVTQNLEINLKQGLQTLNGEQAEQFSRFRNDSLGDIGRVQRQQVLMKALKAKLQNPVMITRIPQAMKLLKNHLDTDLTPKQMLSLASFCRGLEKNNIKMVILPGRFSTPAEYTLSYWLISDRAKNQVMKEYFDLDIDSKDNRPYNLNSPNQIRIAIQNGTANPDLPIAVAKYLAKNDFRNVYMSPNSSPPTQKTQIIAQQGDVHSAKRLQTILEFGNLDASSIGDINSDLTIRVGADAQQLLQNNTFTK
jgi:LCP family protein required for cell wall assembly